MRNINQKGFTLLELMVTIAIIALLASVVLLSLAHARIKSRNTKRITDLSLLQKGLEIYYNNNSANYPNNGAVPNPNTAYDIAVLSSFLVPGAMSGIPKDPSMPAAGAQNYQYAWDLNGDIYAIKIYYSNDVGGTDCAYRSAVKTGQVNNLFPGIPGC